MRIRGGWPGAGWLLACALLSVYAHPARDRANEMHIGRSAGSIESGDYGFGEMFASKSSEIVDDSAEELEEDEVSSTMRAITTRAKSDAVLLPLITEPEAEMLPPGYKGVKPPGVSHMELVFAGSQAGRSDRRRSATARASPTDDDGFDAYHAAASEREALAIARDDRGGDRRVVFEAGATGDAEKQSERSERVESSGEAKSYSEDENRAEERAGTVAVKKDVTYEAGHNRGGARNVAGYRNVYHRDETKKDTDFYDSGRQGGRFKKRGRYGERFAAAEGAYGSGADDDSGMVKTETNKRRKLAETRAS